MSEDEKMQSPPAPETPEAKKKRDAEQIQKYQLEMAAIERTSRVLTSGIDFVARQMCRADEAAAIGEFLGYIRDLKRDMKDRSLVLKEAMKIAAKNPVIVESQLKGAGIGEATDHNGAPTKAPELAAVPA